MYVHSLHCVILLVRSGRVVEVVTLTGMRPSDLDLNVKLSHGKRQCLKGIQGRPKVKREFISLPNRHLKVGNAKGFVGELHILGGDIGTATMKVGAINFLAVFVKLGRGKCRSGRMNAFLGCENATNIVGLVENRIDSVFQKNLASLLVREHDMAFAKGTTHDPGHSLGDLVQNRRHLILFIKTLKERVPNKTRLLTNATELSEVTFILFAQRERFIGQQNGGAARRIIHQG